MCLELKHLVYITRTIQNKAEQASKDTMYLSVLIPTGTLGVRLESCLPPAFSPAFPGRLTRPFQGLLSRGYSLQKHTECSPTAHSSKERSNGKNPWGVRNGLDSCKKEVLMYASTWMNTENIMLGERS